MFVSAIEEAKEFTRPIHSIMRCYKSTEIIPAAATLFILNEDGYALTCKHVVEGLIAPADEINAKYASYKARINEVPLGAKRTKKISDIAKKFGYTSENIIEIYNHLIDCVDRFSELKWICHPVYDLAILKFNGFNELYCKKFPIFLKQTNQIQQGKFLCRLGYPFPEFTNYTYNRETDVIEWSDFGISESPRFPIEGMVTRFVKDEERNFGIELSTPGLKGQSGGPLFDENGIIYGMQYQTIFEYLGFDVVDKTELINNRKKKISNYPYIHLGRCIHVDVIKDFLREHNVKFNEQ